MNNKRIKTEEILTLLTNCGRAAELIGEPMAIEGFCSLKQLRSHCITWAKDPQNYQFSVPEGVDHLLIVSPCRWEPPLKHYSLLVCENPKAVFFSILGEIWGQHPAPCIEPTAVIDDSAVIGKDVYIGHHCYIGPNVTVGNSTVIKHNVSIASPATIGEKCLIHSGAVIGTDGFGFFYREDGTPGKVIHFGGVTIGNDVEIGANACIDRGTIDNTVICDHVKIDNLVHVAHNTIIHSGAMVIANSIVCGSAEIGHNARISPGAIVKEAHRVGDGAFVGLGSVVLKDVPEKAVVVGAPARVIRERRPGE